jgi:glycosyltransferase involved in cell wall biosynthesis
VNGQATGPRQSWHHGAPVADLPFRERPRVLLLSTYYAPLIGGSETHARQLAAYLSGHGFDVWVLTKRVGDLPREDRIDGIPVRRVGPAGPRTGLQKWLMLPAIAWTMLRDRDEYDLVCSPDYRGVGVAAILVARIVGRPSVMATAALGVLSGANVGAALQRLGLAPAGALARAITWPLRRVYRSADAYPAITRAIEREAVENGVPPSRVHYLPNSIDTTRFRPPAPGERDRLRAAIGWPADRLICLYLARLSREKGLLDLLAAWNIVQSQGPLLFVAGPDMDGHDFNVGPAARQLVEERGLSDSVRFLGPTSQPDQFLRAADVMIQPSHWEAAPFATIEAMASGLPVVTTRVGGMAEYIVDGVNGLLAPPHNPPELAAALRRVLTDSGLRQRLGLAARDTAVREFDEQVVCGRYAALFRTLLDERRPDNQRRP